MTWTMTIPVLSTCHIPNEDAIVDLLRSNLCTAPYSEGLFVLIGDASNEQPAPWLQTVADWCHLNYGDDACTWVRFDCDGDDIDELPQWSW